MTIGSTSTALALLANSIAPARMLLNLMLMLQGRRLDLGHGILKSQIRSSVVYERMVALKRDSIRKSF
jgi:hypothetical protein